MAFLHGGTVDPPVARSDGGDRRERDAFRDAYGVQLGEWQRLGDLNWKPYERLIKWTEQGPVPLDRLIITPIGLTHGNFLARVYPEAGT